MKLLTLNTHSWQENQQLAKLDILVNTIAKHDIEVIALQEVNQHQDSENIATSSQAKCVSNRPIKQDNFAYLAQQALVKLGHDYHLCWDYVHHSYEVYQEGLAFLVKAPIKEHLCIDLNDDYDESFWKHRRATRIKIHYQGKDLYLINCHCGWWNDADAPFQHQIDRLMPHVPSDAPCLLFGDFNNPAHLRNEGYDYLLNQGLVDSYQLAHDKDQGTTVLKAIDGWKNNQQELRIDLILTNPIFSQAFDIKQSQVIFNGDNEAVVSDHFGVLVTLDILTIK